MTIAVNPKPLIRREILTAKRKVDTAASLFDADNIAVGEKVFVNDRNVDYELISSTRGQYIDIEATDTSYTNRLIITGATLTASGFNVLPQNTVIEVWARIATGSDLPVAAQDIRINNARYFGFYESGTIKAAVDASSSSAYLELTSVEDEDGVIQDPDDLEKGVWYKLTVTVIHASGITITSGNNLLVGCMGQAAETSNRHYHSLRITKPDESTILWDFESGSLEASVASTAFTVVGTVPFEDNELLGNDLDLIEQASPYLLYRIKPIGGYVTPENFGATKQYNNANIDEDVDATEAIQSCIDSPYNVLIDGYYYVAGTLNITTPKTIELVGTSDGTLVNSRDETVGCLYQGATPVDMFRIFSGGVSITGGLIDLRNCVYDTAAANVAADYMPPVVFRYCYWANLIQYGQLKTKIIGDVERTRVFNGGHIGVFYDATSQFAADPIGKAALYGELHYLKISLECNYIYAAVCGRLTEPYQDYSDSAIINHASIGGFRVASPTSDSGTYVINTTTSSYTVANNAWRLLMFSWGLSSRFAIRVTSNGGSLVSLINRAIVDAGYSTDTSLSAATPAFKAETYLPGSGSNQAFTIRTNQDDLALTVVRPPLATVLDYNITTIGCKYTVQLETGDVCTGYFECQTAPVLAKSGTPVTLDAELSEWDFPCVEMKGENAKLNVYSIDLDVGSGVTYKANQTAWVNYYDTNEMYGRSLESLYNREAKQYNDSASHEALIRNSPYFSHTRYGPGTGATGFIGALDNVLALASARWTVTTRAYVNSGFDFDTVGTADGESGATYSGTIATFANTASLFSDAVAMFEITYDSTFDETDDFIEIRIAGMSGVDVQDVFVQFYTWNRARRVQVISLGDNEDLLLEITTLGNNNDWLEFQRFNPNASDEIIVRLIGVKDKSQTCQIAQIAGKDKYAEAVPKVCRDLRILDEGGTNYRRIIPQDATGITDYATLRAALIDAGIIY